jgi:serine/threonine protein phosphatase 1
MGRLLAVGDIHGCYRSLSALVNAVKLTPEDTLITLGDYVNRGPDTHSVLDWLIHRRQSGKLIPLKGNHEIMMLAARGDETAFANWMAVGGMETLASYSPFGDPGRLSDVPEAHWEFMENELKDFYETEQHIFVHANAYPDVPLADQPEYMLFWEHLDEWTPPQSSGKTMICGHTSQRIGLPLNLGHAVCIDTGACKGGWLTCLEVETGYYWQASEAGQTRESFLPDS